MTEILLYSGVLFDPLNPQPSKILIEDIAHALANIPRWTGHTKHFYSVAQHSLRCLELAEMLGYKCGLEILLHDATEAYLLDMATPIKCRMPDYQKAETKLYNTIDFVFDLETSFYKDQIKYVDKMVLDEEYHFLMNHGKQIEYTDQLFKQYGIFQRQEGVEAQFLETFKRLNDERIANNQKNI